jgi:tetratricopeptide (TPR) repeat protein
MEKELQKLLSANKVIPFVGAGVSMAVTDKKGQKVFPSWRELLTSFAEKLRDLGKEKEANGIRALLEMPKPDYLYIADLIKESFPTISHYEDYLASTFDFSFNEIEPSSLDLARSIWDLKQNLIITTNYEKVMQWASPKPQDTKYWDIQAISEQASSLRSDISVPTIWHLHGHIDNKSNIILTTNSYKKLYDEQESEFKTAFATLKHYLASKSFLFIGYSLDDEFFVNELEKICEVFQGHSSEHYILLKKDTFFPAKFDKKIIPIYYEDRGQLLIDKIKSLSPSDKILSVEPKITPIKRDVDYLTKLPPRNDNFLGRKQELEDLGNTLTKEGMVYVVNGIGGVGKSELSYEYLHRNKDRYNNIAFFEFSSETSSLENQLRTKLQDRFQFTEKDDMDSIIARLQRLQPKNLLVLDNLQNKDDFEKIKPLNVNFDILITTRRGDLESRYKLNLEVLNDEDAKALFLQYFDTQEDITDILEYLGNHSLFIYLMSNTLASGFITLEKLRTDIKEGKVAKIEAHDEKTFNEHLNQRFQQQFETERNDELKLLLQQLSILPSIEIEEEKLHICIKHENLTKNLSKLVKHGWLSKKGSSYKLHQIIRTFLLENAPLEYRYASAIMESISSFLDPYDYSLIANYELVFLPIIDSLLSLYEDQQDKYIAKILDSLTLLYFSLGNYPLSLVTQEKSEKIHSNVFGTGSTEIAKNYNLQGVLYYSMGNIDRAMELYQKALEIQVKAVGEKHSDTATIYINIANTYRTQRNFPKALELHQKALGINIDIFEDEKKPIIATSYNNIAMVYSNMGNFPKALELYQKALDIRLETLEGKHPHIATSYNNVATAYDDMGNNLSKTLDLYKKALEIREEVLGEKHPDTATIYFNISQIYLDKKQCCKALDYIDKAINILKSLDFEFPKISKYEKGHREIMDSIKKENKLPYNKKGRYCIDCLPSS